MSDRSTSESRNLERRFQDDVREGKERRSWEERRTGERRTSSKEVDVERRATTNRRSGSDRRVMLLDRRRRMSDPYVQQHAELIREMLLNPDTPVACPRCGGNLLLRPSLERGDATAQEVRCTKCRHCVVITGLPPELTSHDTD